MRGVQIERERNLLYCRAEIMLALKLHLFSMFLNAYPCVDDWIILSLITGIAYVLITIIYIVAWPQQENMG